MRVALDTNILAYAEGVNGAPMRKAALELVQRLPEGGSKQKLAAVEHRKPGDPNPYVVGKDSVQRYLTVEEECAKAGLLRVQQTGQ